MEILDEREESSDPSPLELVGRILKLPWMTCMLQGGSIGIKDLKLTDSKKMIEMLLTSTR